MATAGHDGGGWWGWCLPEDEKKEVEPIFSEKI